VIKIEDSEQAGEANDLKLQLVDAGLAERERTGGLPT
jgi:hypothetical protein